MTANRSPACASKLLYRPALLPDALVAQHAYFGPSGSFTVKDDFQLDIGFILDAMTVTCGGASLPEVDETVVLTGSFSLTPFMIPYLILFFEHNGAEHWFESLSTLPDPWPPTTSEPVEVTQKSTGEWSIQPKAKTIRRAALGRVGLVIIL